MKNTLKFTLTAALLFAAPLASAQPADCIAISSSVKSAVIADSEKVLEIVVSALEANSSCACEIVKAAIVGSDADKGLVARIVETAILETPSEARVIAQCAMATAPDSVSAVQAVMEKYDAAGGEGYSAKGGFDDSKGGMDDGKGTPVDPADGPNPLDYPFQSLDDPIGLPGIQWTPQFFFPPVEDDPNVTEIGGGASSPGIGSPGSGSPGAGSPGSESSFE